jgi:hypothetical protein
MFIDSRFCGKKICTFEIIINSGYWVPVFAITYAEASAVKESFGW